MDGIPAGFPGGNKNIIQQMNASFVPNLQVATQQQQQQQLQLQQQQQQQQQLLQHPQPLPLPQQSPDLTPKRQAVFDRLKRRMGIYRRRQTDCVPRFDQTFTGVCEQQSVETNVLQKRFLESKAKRVAKKADKKTTDVVTSVQGSVTVVSVKQNYITLFAN